MNTNLQKKFLRMSRLTLYALALSTSLSLGATHLSKAQDKQLRDVTLTLSSEEDRLVPLFGAIGQLSGFRFAYSPEEVASQTVKISPRAWNLHALLREISQQSGLAFRRVGETITVKQMTRRAQVAVTDEEASAVEVSGRITDEGGSGLPGATVLEKGTANGTVTNTSGNYTIMTSDEATLIVSFVGYQSQEIAVNGRSVIDVILRDDVSALEEVVVVGYGSVKRSDLTGSLSSIGSEDFQDFPIVDASQAIKGLAAGVAVTQNSGVPGGDVKIRIRGANSILGGNDPLLVIDGIQTNINLSDINPNDIKSIQILKDASATAIFGSRGANGVILVETKNGVAGPVKLNYESFVSFKNVTSRYDVLEAADYATLLNEVFDNKVYSDEEIAEFRQNGGTDWQEAILQRGLLHNHQLGVSGASESTSFYISGNYAQEDGVIIGTNYDRLSLRANVDTKISSIINLGFNLATIRENSHNMQSQYEEIFDAVNWSPTVPIFNDDGTYVTSDPYGSILRNPYMRIKEKNSDNESSNTLLSTYLQVNLTPDLTWKTTVGANYSTGNFGYVNNQYIDPNISSGRGTFESKFWQLSNILTYAKTFGTIHALSVMAGFEQSQSEASNFSATGNNLATPSVGYDNLSLNANQSIASDYNDSQLRSYIGRVNYTLNDRYLLTATLRADGSSKFRGDNQYGYFPSVALGWKVGEEPFLQNQNLLGDLKLRASYGLTGNQAIPAYGTLALLTQSNYSYGTQITYPGYTLTGVANPDIRWETTAMLDIGVDFTLFDSRVAVTLDYFDKRTTDLHQAVNIPAYNGGGSVIRNLGEVANNGFELNISAVPVSTSAWTWNTDFNVSYINNRVVSLGEEERIFPETDYFFEDQFYVVTPGEPLGTFYGYQDIGIWRTAEADEAAVYGNVPGDTKYQDTDGNQVIDSDDLQVIGYANPPYRLGFNNSVTYKNFRLNAFLEGVFGFDVFNAVLATAAIPQSGGRSITLQDGADYWTPQNDDARYPNSQSTTNRNFNNSSRWLQSGDFIRLNNVSLAYRLPENVSEAFDLELYVSGQNVFTITEFTGTDPEASATGSQDTNGSNNIGLYPRTRAITVGLKLGF
ncbi:MAG: TonB-dependent receptor [Tunicatimonas sp.]